ncbi:amidohydrolase [Carnobacterium sp. TMP28]|uniref:amidohydrolase n=1 Tax=Carnobacterium sp. TMP28 TaxID=3397060 RepID=UPI0039DF779F
MTELRELFLKKLSKNEKIAYDLNHYLAENPELSGQEYNSVKKITELLRKKGIEVEDKVAGLDTSFRARITKSHEDKPKFGIIMEYDALPEIGHACGHSASGSLSLLAALTLWEMKDSFDATVDLIGTPDEEVMGAKIPMAKAGVFDDYDSVLMIHMNSNETLPAVHFLALSEIKVSFKGITSHAAAAPWDGKNALNAAILTTNAIDMMRQQLKPDTRVSYIITNGGQASNVIPGEAEMIINMRNSSKFDLEDTVQKVMNCIKGASIATDIEYTTALTGPEFEDMNINDAGSEAIKMIMDSINLPYVEEKQGQATGSSDIGTVSYVCPAFHPMLAISDHYFSLHTKEVADRMKSDSINGVISQGAKVIGLFILKAIEDPTLLKEIKEEFQKSTLAN